MRWLLPLILLLAACGGKSIPTLQPVPGEREPRVVVAPAVEHFMAFVQQRVTGHSTQPDQEYAMCLRGYTEPGAVHITGVAPALILSAAVDSLTLQRCDPEPDYLGVWHTHPWYMGRDGCWFSATDTKRFSESGDVLHVVTCTQADGRVAMVSQVRKGYSLMARR